MSGLIGMAALKTALNGPLALARRGWAWLGTLNPWQSLSLALGLLALFQHVLIVAAHRHAAKVEAQYGRERDAHAADIARWKAGQFAATKLNQATLARVAQQQQAITKETANDYQAQLADLRARLGRMRTAPATDNRRPTDGDRASPLPVAAGGPDGQAVPGDQPDLRYVAETELQLNALIDWIKRQSAVDPNAH